MATQTLKIEQNNKPEEVAWKFIHTLQSLGIKVEENSPLEYTITYNKHTTLQELNPAYTKRRNT